jgi:hypothetical protein
VRPHCQRTRQAIAEQPRVLILPDTTELDCTSHHALQGAGPIGDGNGNGFLPHNRLAVLPQPRQVIGLTHQQLRVRPPKAPRQSSHQRKQPRRASELCREGLAAAGQAAPTCCGVDVGDRGSDIEEAMRQTRAWQHHFLFRVCQDRSVLVADDPLLRTVPLRTYARSLPAQGRDRVDLPARGGRPTRSVEVSRASAPVRVPAPAGTPQRHAQPVLPAWVIRIGEEPTPQGGVPPLEWILLGSLPTEGLEAMRQRRDWYACRWMGEVYHDIEKNGCSEEERRFETAGRMEACLAVLSVVAVRVLPWRYALETGAEESAEQVATATQIQVLCRHLGHKKKTFTVRDIVVGVAKLGGFLGRKGDGDPGVRSLWRGYQRLQDMVVGCHLHAP